MKQLRDKRFDFLRADERPEFRRDERRRIALIVAPIALCIAFLTTFGVLQILISRGGEERAMLENYLADSEHQNYYDQALLLIEQDEVERLEQQKLTEMRGALLELRTLTPEMVELIRAAASGSAEIREMAYSEAEETLTILATAGTVESAARFSQSLRESGVFEELNYAGYQGSSGNQYEFTVTGRLKGGAADGAAGTGTDGE